MAELPHARPADLSFLPPSHFRGWAWHIVSALLLTIWFYSPVRVMAPPTLDGSNFASFAYFTSKGFQYGEDVFHVGGPLAFVQYGFVYAGYLFWKRLPLELLVKFTLALLAVGFVRSAGRTPWRWLWLGILIVLIPLVEDLAYDLAILLAGLALVGTGTGVLPWTKEEGTGTRASRPPQFRSQPLPAAILSAALAAFLALMTLIKGTHAVLGLATLGLVVLQAGLSRNLRHAAIAIVSYLVALALFLLLAGQNPLNFPAYLHSVLQQSSGYNKAMVLDEPRAVFLVGLAAILILQAMITLALWRRWSFPRVLCSGLLLAGYCFVEWKHGFVRADGHVYIFFHFASLTGLTIYLFFRESMDTRRRNALLVGAIATLALGIWADGPQALWRYRWAAEDTQERLRATFAQLFTPARAKAGLDARFTEFRDRYALPLIRGIVKGDAIDFYGLDHGYLTLNRLNYRPRPMGGGNFSVFNAWLQDRNFVHVADPDRAPPWFLVGVEMFDHRFVAQEDAGTLRALLAQYEPVETEQGMVLFKRRAAGAVPEPQLIGERTFALDETIPLPDPGRGQLLAVELDAPFNLAGNLRTLLYKAPLLFLSMDGDGIVHPHSRRVVTGMFQRPVILSPVLEDTRDFLQLYGAAAGKKVRTARFHTARPDLFATDSFQIRFYSVPRPAASHAGQLAYLNRRLAFPVATRSPDRWTPPNAPLRRFEALLVQMLEPPGRIEFPVNDRDNVVTFTYGIDPAAYLDDGQTDGVEFIVELVKPGQPPQILFRHWLRPKSNVADHGFHSARVVLPPKSGGATLALRTEPGADGDGAWDWGFFSRIHIAGDGFSAEQFPGFVSTPIDAEYTAGGPFQHESRAIFMLNAPGSVTLRAGDARALAFSGGLLPGAYSGAGESDGVTFAVYVEENGARRRIFSHHIDPRANEGDRGSRPFAVDLPKLAPDAHIIVATEPGPTNNAAWDWSFIDQLRLQ